MPGFDRTGPAGMGPMTGCRRGFCASPHPGMADPSFMCGFSGKRGDRGRRNWFYATGLPRWQRVASYGPVWTVKEEKEALKDQVEFLKGQLNELQNRIATLEKEES